MTAAAHKTLILDASDLKGLASTLEKFNEASHVLSKGVIQKTDDHDVEHDFAVYWDEENGAYYLKLQVKA